MGIKWGIVRSTEKESAVNNTLASIHRAAPGVCALIEREDPELARLLRRFIARAHRLDFARFSRFLTEQMAEMRQEQLARAA
jgi:hypothetical protein